MDGEITGLKFKFYPMVHADAACTAAMKSMSVAREALREEERKFEAAIRATTFFKSIEALAESHSDITINMAESRIELWQGRYSRWGVEVKKHAAPNHIDPKTLNALLNGKLLSIEEKRGLLKAQGFDLEAFASPALERPLTNTTGAQS